MMASSSSLNHGLTDGKEYQLNLGKSFVPRKASESYHLMRYDFKPASAETSRPAEVNIGKNNQCTVTVPNDTGTTTYKGGKKPCTKECILIIDRETGEITLERISSTIALKKSRGDRAPNPPLNKPSSKTTPATTKPSTSTNSTTSNTMSISKQTTPLSSSHSSSQNSTSSSVPAKLNNHAHNNNTTVKGREISTTSTSDSNSSSSESSDSDSETEKEMAAHIEMETFSSKAYEPPPPPVATTAPPTATKPGGMFLSNLHSDLQLSDSNESDSD